MTPCVSCLSGGCKWIRTPAIVYSTHVATTLVPILAHILFYQFPTKPHPGPQTLQERWLLVSIYAPYLVVPVLLLLTMLLSSTYNPTSMSGRKSAKAKKNWLTVRLQLYDLLLILWGECTICMWSTCMWAAVWVTLHLLLLLIAIVEPARMNTFNVTL